MTKILVEDVETNHEQWLKEKAGARVGSSEIAIIAGFSGYKSPYKLWAEKTGKVEPDFIDNDHMRFGRHNESYVVDLFERRSGLPTKPLKNLYQADGHDFAIASPDAVAATPEADLRLVEVKTATNNNAHKWGENQAPELYQIQLQWQLGVLGLQEGYIAGLVGGDPRTFYYPRYKFDAAMFEGLLTLAGEFARCVEKDIPPDPGADDSKLIEELAKRVKGKVRKFSAEQSEDLNECLYLIKTLQNTKSEFEAEARRVGNEVKTLQNSLKLALGDASVGQLADGREFKVSEITVPARQQDAYQYTRFYLPK